MRAVVTKSRILSVIVITFFLLISSTQLTSAASTSYTFTFDTPSDLLAHFTPGVNTDFVNESAGGINDSGSVFVPLGSSEIWTAKHSYAVEGSSDVYGFSGFFHVVANSGYGGFGITPNPSNEDLNGMGQPGQGLGISFHGGGAEITNNGVYYNSFSWGKDLVLGNWYYVTFEISRTGANTYAIELIIRDSDETGLIGNIFTTQSLAAIPNAPLAGASKVHPFISASGMRMDRFDNITLTGSILDASGAPIAAPIENTPGVMPIASTPTAAPHAPTTGFARTQDNVNLIQVSFLLLSGSMLLALTVRRYKTSIR